MCDLGDRWQARLEGHFLALTTRRSPGQAVFGLEHGLEAHELAEVEDLVRAHVRSTSERRRHWLLWIVHGSELGYHFAGDEYWQTFEQQTPGWDHEWRDWIRQIFYKFHKGFRGPKPSGAWADWFSIIAWPITNAILPTDLQRHLARALYEVRGRLLPHLGDPEELGRFISDNTWHATDRFEKLTQQPLLLGQISLALLRPQSVGDETILRSTLERIASDLERERQAAAWLKQARRSVEQPVIRAGGSTFVRVQPESVTLVERVRDAARSSAPRVFLRQAGAEGVRWSVRLKLPYVGPLLEISPDVRDAIMKSRCWAPAASAPIARGRLAYASQELPLLRWPKPREPLVRFQDLSEGLESALLDEWVMSDEPWLFGVRHDGTAVELRALQVRPGRSYLLASSTRTETDDPRLALLEADCEGLFLRLLRLPHALTSEWIRLLGNLGLRPTRSVLLRPAGFVPAEWDGESWAQWVSSDVSMLRVTADHPVQELVCELEGVASVTLEGLVPGRTSFLQVPALPPGRYTLRIQEHNDGVEDAGSAITLEVREPRPIRADHTGPLVVWTEPFSTRLDQLWEGVTAICAAGAAGQRCRCHFILADRPAGETLAETAAGEVPLPLLTRDWRSLFREHLQSSPEMEAAYEQATWAQVVFDAGPYGRYTLEFDRQLPPVRWRVRSKRDAYALELHDDTESGSVPRLRYATFQAPDTWLSIPADTGHSALSADPAGGVYVARLGSRVAAIVVPPAARTLHSQRDLSLRPCLSARARQSESLAGLVETTQIWAAARLPGDVLARAWRTQVVRDLQAELFSLICGRDWREAECALRECPSERALERLQEMVGSFPAAARTVAGALVARPAKITQLPPEERIGHVNMLTRRGGEVAGLTWRELASQHEAITAEWLAEFSLRAASDAHLPTWAGDRLKDALELLIAWPLPAMVARCLVLWSVVGTDMSGDFPPLFPDWDWSLV